MCLFFTSSLSTSSPSPTDCTESLDSLPLSLCLSAFLFLSSSVPIVHRFWEILLTASGVRRELMYISLLVGRHWCVHG